MSNNIMAPKQAAEKKGCHNEFLCVGTTVSKMYNTGTWSKPEDVFLLFGLWEQGGPGLWNDIARRIAECTGSQRTPKSARLRYLNQLDPSLLKTTLDPAEHELVAYAWLVHPNQWADIMRLVNKGRALLRGASLEEVEAPTFKPKSRRSDSLIKNHFVKYIKGRLAPQLMNEAKERALMREQWQREVLRGSLKEAVGPGFEGGADCDHLLSSWTVRAEEAVLRCIAECCVRANGLNEDARQTSRKKLQFVLPPWTKRTATFLPKAAASARQEHALLRRKHESSGLPPQLSSPPHSPSCIHDFPPTPKRLRLLSEEALGPSGLSSLPSSHHRAQMSSAASSTLAAALARGDPGLALAIRLLQGGARAEQPASLERTEAAQSALLLRCQQEHQLLASSQQLKSSVSVGGSHLRLPPAAPAPPSLPSAASCKLESILKAVFPGEDPRLSTMVKQLSPNGGGAYPFSLPWITAALEGAGQLPQLPQQPSQMHAPQKQQPQLKELQQPQLQCSQVQSLGHTDVKELMRDDSSPTSSGRPPHLYNFFGPKAEEG